MPISKYWHSSQTLNQKDLLDIIKSIQASGYQIGIITWKKFWNSVMGVNFRDPLLKSLKLIYGTFTYERVGFQDFEPFGDWEKPFGKFNAKKTTAECFMQLGESMRIEN